jgi:hypothetical protein
MCIANPGSHVGKPKSRHVARPYQELTALEPSYSSLVGLIGLLARTSAHRLRRGPTGLRGREAGELGPGLGVPVLAATRAPIHRVHRDEQRGRPGFVLCGNSTLGATTFPGCGGLQLSHERCDSLPNLIPRSSHLINRASAWIGETPCGDPKEDGQTPSGLVPASAASTSPSCSAGLTLRNTCATFPSAPTMNVVRSLPKYFFPYIDFSTQTP